jgi:hypothetical protein
VEIFVRPMRYNGCHQAHNAKVGNMCPFLFGITGTAKGVFTHSQSSCHIAKVVLALTAAAKSPQRLTRHLAIPHAVSSIGGLRMPAPVRAAPPSWAGIRKPSQKLTHASQQNDLLEFLVLHSSNASARKISPGGISSPSALAVLRLTTISSLVGCSTGRSAGFTPFRILST